MGEQVQVESLDSLRKFREALCRVAERIQSALNEADGEVRRTASWLALDQQNRWKSELRKRTEIFGRAKRALSRKKAEKTPLGGHYSTVDEEKELARATRALEEAQQKSENVRTWRRKLDEEYFNYKAAAQGLAQTVEVDVPVALSQLDAMIAAIEAYALGTAPVEVGSVAVSLDDGERAYSRTDDPSAHADLRARTPTLDLLDQARLVAVSELAWLPAELSDADRRTLTGLKLDTQSIVDADRFVVATSVANADRVYGQRVATPDGGDWYFDDADGPRTDERQATKLRDVIAIREDLTPLLTLPAGSIVVLARGSLEALLDAQDTLLWTDAATRPPEHTDP